MFSLSILILMIFTAGFAHADDFEIFSAGRRFATMEAYQDAKRGKVDDEKKSRRQVRPLGRKTDGGLLDLIPLPRFRSISLLPVIPIKPDTEARRLLDPLTAEKFRILDVKTALVDKMNEFFARKEEGYLDLNPDEIPDAIHRALDDAPGTLLLLSDPERMRILELNTGNAGKALPAHEE